MLITPEYVFKDVTHITPEWLAAKASRLWCWIRQYPDRRPQSGAAGGGGRVACRHAQGRGKADHRLQRCGKAVRPFAEKLGLAYLYRAAKPLPFALMVAQHRMGVKHRQMAMVGDQLYADRMVAALYGIPGLRSSPAGRTWAHRSS